MSTDANKNTTTTTKGGFQPNAVDTPLDVRTRVETEADILNILRPYIGMVVYVKDTGKRYEVTSLKDLKSGLTTIKNGAVDGYREIASSNEIQDKIDEILMTSSEANDKLWENLKFLMEESNLVEGIHRILEGKQQDKVLGITPDDIGKILSVAQASDGEMMVKAIDNILANQIEYVHEEYPVTTVEDALDKLFEMQGEALSELTWDMIMGKPEVPTGLELTNDALVMMGEHGEMSEVPLMTDEDVNTLINDLEM